MKFAAMTVSLAIASAAALAAQAPPKSKAGPVAKRAAAGEVVARAHADIKGEGITGTADLAERREATSTIVEVVVHARGLKPGPHAVHLHAIGKCDPDFTAAGGHFDPGPFGNTDPDANHPYHMGDLPMLNVEANGEGTLRTVTTRVTLTDGPLTLFDADGAAIIIHGNPDQMRTGEPKSGVSGGPRVACGVLQKQ